MKKFTLILSLLMTMFLGVNAQVLKVSDSPANGEWAENTVWYLIQNKKGGYVSTADAYCNTDGKLLLNNSTAPGDSNENALWCIVGSEESGYKFYNKAHGTSKVLLASRTLNSGSASFQMAEVADAAGEYFDIANSQKFGYIIIKDHNNGNNYWNNRDNNLAYWNDSRANNDDGSSFAFLDIDEFDATLAEASGVIEMAEVQYSATPVVTKDNAESMMFSNAYCTDTRYEDLFTSWDVLFDDNVNSFFHSEYATGKTSTDGLDHYLRVDMGEGKTIEEFQFSYITRNITNGNNHPNNLVVEGSNEPDGTYTKIIEYNNELPNGAALKFVSGILTCNEPYRYIRFRVVSTYQNNDKDAGGKPFFFMSEFGFVAPTFSINQKYEAYREDFIQLYNRVEEARNASSVNDRVVTLSYINTTLTSLYKVVLQDKITELMEYVNNSGVAVGQYSNTDAIVTAVDNANNVLENEASTKNDFVTVIEILNALELPTINLPVDGKFYLIRSAVKENGYIYAGLANTEVGDKDETNKACWATATTPTNVNIWKCEVVDGNIYLKNVHTASYFSSTASYEPTILSETEKGVITFTALGDRQVNIKVNGRQIHAQDVGGYVVPWDGGKNTASAWYVEDIASPVNHTLSVGNVGYATLCLGFDAVIPTIEGEGNGVFIATTSTIAGNVHLTSVIGVLPANTAVIVKANPGATCEFAYSTDTPAEIEENFLSGTLYDKNIAEEAYVLGIKENTVGLYKATTTGVTDGFKNNANKAYLPVSALPTDAAQSASLRFDFGGTTAIEEMTEQRAESKAIFDITGRRVNDITKAGVYIVNGKKVLVK